MEPDTVTTPKINKTTFKIGSGDLASQVAKNTKKITLLRTVVQRQSNKINEQLVPNISNVRESLVETNTILQEISKLVQADYKDRIDRLNQQINEDKKKLQLDERRKKEDELENSKRGNKIGKKLSSSLTKPFLSLFDSLIELATILGIGLVTNNVIRFVTDPKNAEKIEKIFTTIKNNANTILIAGGFLLALSAFSGLSKAYKLAIGLLGFFKTTLGVLLLPLMLGGSTKKGENLRENTATQEDFRRFLDREDRNKFFGYEGFLNEYYKREDVAALITKAAEMTKAGEMSENDRQAIFLNLARIAMDEFVRTYDGGKYLQKDGAEQFLMENTTLPKLQIGGFSHGLSIAHPGEFVLSKNAVDKMGLAKLYAMNSGMSMNNPNIIMGDLEPIVINDGKYNVNNKIPATQVASLSSVNINNPYMKEVPISFGFDNIVYS